MRVSSSGRPCGGAARVIPAVGATSKVRARWQTRSSTAKWAKRERVAATRGETARGSANAGIPCPPYSRPVVGARRGAAAYATSTVNDADAVPTPLLATSEYCIFGVTGGPPVVWTREIRPLVASNVRNDGRAGVTFQVIGALPGGVSVGRNEPTLEYVWSCMLFIERFPGNIGTC